MRMWFGERKYAWGLLGILWIIGCIGALSRFVMAYYQATIAEDFEVGRSFISVAWSSNLLIAAISAPIGGYLVDKYGAKLILITSVIIGAIGSLLVYLFPNPVTFFLAFGLLSGLIGLGATTSFTLVVHWFKRRRGMALTILNSASPLGLALVTPLFIQAEGLTWNVAFLLSSLLSFGLVVPLTTAFMRNGPADKTDSVSDDVTLTVEKKERNRWQNLKHQLSMAISTPVMPIIIMALFACGFHMGTVEMNMVAIHQHAHVSSSQIALAVSLLGLMEVAGSFVFGYMLDKIPRALALAMLYGIRTIGFGFLFLHLDATPVLFSVLFGAAYNTTVPGSLLLAQETTKGSATQTGFLLLFHQGGGVIAALLAGILFDALGNYQLHIALDAFFAVIVSLGFIWLHFYLRKRGSLPN
ncbi:MFS transporter [Cohnella silvisoli]|uniref:MFS transporter n=1 Tax=Cohnella silvisoli TaxID=2873699 RepID=A0ABV1KQ09_9BACL|nr:MFS transporter [Cohnella silvisoli]MCD9022193.1 MFS transporter [Cohnella silvisoli]